MAGFGRDEVVWYYRLGDEALGPVAWREIDELLEDTVHPRDLLVMRSDESDWRPAHRVLWRVEEADARAEDSDGRRPLKPIRGVVPLTRKWPLGGLSEWNAQTWRIVSEDMGHYIVGSVVLLLVSPLSLMICFPALHAGYYIMALHRFRGGTMEHCSVVDGFAHFREAWRLYGMVFLIGLPLAALAIAVVGASVEPGPPLLMIIGVYWPLSALAMSLPGAAAFFAVPLIVDREMTAVDALRASWAVTRRRYLRYLLLTIGLVVESGMAGNVLVFFLPVTLPMLPAGQVCLYEAEFPKREAEIHRAQGREGESR